MRKAAIVVLTPAQRADLASRLEFQPLTGRQRRRVQILLLADQGQTDEQIVAGPLEPHLRGESARRLGLKLHQAHGTGGRRRLRIELAFDLNDREDHQGIDPEPLCMPLHQRQDALGISRRHRVLRAQ